MTKEIEVNRRAWHARVYLWWYYTKWPHRRSEGPKTASNLCPYVRAVVLWAPLRWLFYQGRIGKVQLRVAWIAWPIFLVSIPQPLGYISYNLKRALWISDAILGAAAVIIGLCFVVVYIAEWADRKWYWASRLKTWKIDRRHRAEVRREGPPRRRAAQQPRAEPRAPASARASEARSERSERRGVRGTPRPPAKENARA